MLVACRLAGLSALEAHYWLTLHGAKSRSRGSRRTVERPARAYRAIKGTLPAGSTVYPPERNAHVQYLLWLTEAEANRLTAIRAAAAAS